VDWADVGLTVTGRYVSKLREVGGNVMDSVFYTDLQLRFLAGAQDEFGFALGVNNLFDKETPGCVTCESNNFSQTAHDIPGRYFYARASFKM
jgi:iron complex outermembrane receptor protein